jgi:beta-N-acetylhexosaminidase
MNLSLDVKIGQMIMIGFRGLFVTDDHPIVQDLREFHVGSIVFFAYDVANNVPVFNIESPEQVRRLTRSLQGFASSPLLISIDQEGGKVNRLIQEQGFSPSVSAAYLGSLNDLNTTRRYAELTGKTLSEIGINLNLAPDVDLNINPNNPIIAQRERSYSSDPTIVTAHAKEVINGHHKYGVLCTLKHFPGHGSSSHDSHLGFVDVTASWNEQELQPYTNMINAGLCDAVMTAHIYNANLDPDFPATLSKQIITGILRQRLHYDGVIISDDMQMKAISEYYGLETAVYRAIDAGVDIISFANNSVNDPDIVPRVTRIIRHLIQSEAISEARIDESYRRIRTLKARMIH